MKLNEFTSIDVDEDSTKQNLKTIALAKLLKSMFCFAIYLIRFWILFFFLFNGKVVFDCLKNLFDVVDHV